MTSETTRENLERIEIPLNRKKNIWILLDSLVYCALVIWIIIDPARFFDQKDHTLTLTFWVVIAALLLFSAFSFFAAYLLFKNNQGVIFDNPLFSLFNKNQGMIIDQQGLRLNVSPIKNGILLWSDIKGFSIENINNSTCLVILLNNPDEYIENEKNNLKRSTMQSNLTLSGSPVCLNANMFNMDIEALRTLLTERLAQMHRSAPNR